MGRKLANSACDEEEGLLNSGSLDFTGLFRKEKIQSGFGIPMVVTWLGQAKTSSPQVFTSTGLTPLFAGIFQADLERINSKRYRMRWEEKSAENCVLIWMNQTFL